MTDNEAEILAGLEKLPADTFHRPRAFGGGNGSHHAVTAGRMADKGWLERMMHTAPAALEEFISAGRFVKSRPTYSYRPTDRGRQALANHRACMALRRS